MSILGKIHKGFSIISHILYKDKSKYGFSGYYSSWESAEIDCDGYDSDKIFQKAIISAVAVKNGEAAYERDTCLFYEKEYNYSLVAYINKALLDSKDSSKEIVDFGGAFGSTYQQNKDLFPNDIKWTVVEQEHFVKYGKEHFTDEHLSFEYTIDNVTSKTCVLCSGSLQYIMNYKEYLDLMIKHGFMYIIIERTSVSDKEWIMIQNVQEPIYDASYPLYVFKEDEFIKHFTSKNYRLIDSWTSLVDGIVEYAGSTVREKSFVFKKC